MSSEISFSHLLLINVLISLVIGLIIGCILAYIFIDDNDNKESEELPKNHYSPLGEP